jgi:NNP family nitrate/nitrite transporter-like MFS transporter
MEFEEIDGAECPMPEPFAARIGMTLFLSWLFFLSFVTRIIFGPLMPAIEKEMAISHSQAGSLFLMMSLGYLIAPLCSGLISSKIHHRGALNLSAWLVGAVLIPFLFVGGLWPVRLLLMAIGLAAGIHLPSAIATLTAEIRKVDWGKALSVHQAAPQLAFVSAPLIAAALVGLFSWRMVLAILAGLALLSALLYSFFGRGGDFSGKLPSPKNVKFILAQPAFYVMVMLFAMAMGGNAGIFAMLPLFLVHERGLELGWANTIVGLSQITGLCTIFAAGWLADRFGQKVTMGGVLLLGGALTIGIALLQGKLLVAAIFIQPALVSSFFPAAFAAMARIAPPALRSVTSALGPPAAFLIGGGILPMVIGWLGQTYTFSAGIMVAGISMLIGPLLVLLLKLGQFDNQAGC